MDIKIKKKLLVATLISSALMVFLLFQVDWEHFYLIVDRVDIVYFITSFLLFILANFIRSIRFHHIDHTGTKLSSWWVVNHVYSFTTATLPGGAGEPATAYLLKRFSNYNMFSALRILILTRFMDLAGYSALLLCTAIIITDTTPYREVALWLSVALFIISIIVVHPVSEGIVIRVLKRFSDKGRMMTRICERLEEVAAISEKRFSGAFFGMTMVQTVLMIAGAALAVHFMLLSFGTEFMLIQSLYCFSVYTLFQMVPVQGIAGIGTQAAWWTLALTVSGYSAPDAVALGIVLHATFYVIIAILGIAAVLFWQILRMHK